ncbi:hypothetical protein GCK32_009118 [Trichostrongylus colubriformis]|uniref:Uncharacterized protein n=1 Tax=Trichostrongylus colubriformis TaxID=6319 RepID=A0AAN8J3D3_TRICO
MMILKFATRFCKLLGFTFFNFHLYAAAFLGMEVRRVISEPTAASLAYGLHKNKGVESVVVIDLGGGTLDVSVLWLQGGTFVTQDMAGNNWLGGQDFNDRIQKHMLSVRICQHI